MIPMMIKNSWLTPEKCTFFARFADVLLPLLLLKVPMLKTRGVQPFHFLQIFFKKLEVERDPKNKCLDVR